MHKRRVSTHNMYLEKPENRSRVGVEKGKGQMLGDLMITNRHGVQLDVHR